MVEPHVTGAIARPDKGFIRGSIEDAERIVRRNTRRILAIVTLLGAETAGLAIIVCGLLTGDTQMAFQVFLILGGYAAGALNGYNLARAEEEAQRGSGSKAVVDGE